VVPVTRADRRRRWAAGVVVAVGVAGFITPFRGLVQHVRLVRDPAVTGAAEIQRGHLNCVREALEDVPDRPTYVVPFERGTRVEWYQRTIELGFDEVPFVARREDAEQLLEVVVDGDVDGVCGVLSVRVLRP
jgi:hypothetical protein